MPRLSRAQETTRQQIIQLGRSGLPVNQLGERLIAAIELAVPADGAQLCAVDPTTLLFNRLLAVSAGGRPHVHWYLRHRYLNEAYADFTHPAMMRAGLTAVVLHDRPETCLGLSRDLASQVSPPELYRAYHEFTGAQGGNLRAFFSANGQWIAALDLARFEPGKPFRPSDVAFLRLIAPVIGRIIRAALERERATNNSADTTAVETCGVLILGPNRHIQSYTPLAENWLKALRDAEVSQENQLPTVIWAAVAGLRAGGSGSTHAAVHVPTDKGRLRVEASPAGTDGTVAVILVPQSRPVAPAIPTHWILTRQERQVVEQLVRGLSNRQVARSLMVTENTVESHLKHVYEKLDVQSRSQLLARYFAEVYNPDLF
jgi:DNA-binding CsgD family transcriptional regulator